MSRDDMIEKMIVDVERIEREALVEKYAKETDLKKDAVSKIYKCLQEVTSNED